MSMKDGFGRTLDYLRISVTDGCNLRCRYCMPVEQRRAGRGELLTYEELLRLSGLLAGLGVTRVKITGGEPLIREKLSSFIRQLKELPGIRAVTLTTNGVLLRRQLSGLLEAGLDGINISLDTLNREKYREMTGMDALLEVRAGIREALSQGAAVKINCVPIKGWNEEELEELAALAAENRLDVRFIAVMPIGYGTSFSSPDREELLARFQARFPGLSPDTEIHGNGPAFYYRSPALKGGIGFIDSMSRPFCEQCSRLRLTSAGFLKTCLCFADGVDLRAPLRGGASDRELVRLIKQAVLRKPFGHRFGEPAEGLERKGMSEIGG